MRRLELIIGGEKVPLNKFAREVISNTLLGMLKSLNRVNLDEEISIRLGREN